MVAGLSAVKIHRQRRQERSLCNQHTARRILVAAGLCDEILWYWYHMREALLSEQVLM
jgi:hypothetical protein